MLEETKGFIERFADLVTTEEFKSHIISYAEYPDEDALVKALVDGVSAQIFVNPAQMHMKKPHKQIVEILYRLCTFVQGHKKTPFSLHQALSDGSSEYMDTEIIKKILIVAKTWE